MATIEATFYLPVRDNDGRDLSAEIAEVETGCFIAFGAWTLNGYFKGAWRMESGEKALDTSAVYTILLAPDRVEELEEILRRFKAQTNQESVLLKLNPNVEMRLI